MTRQEIRGTKIKLLSSGRMRIPVLILVLMLAAVVLSFFHWGTHWRVPRGNAGGARYELSGYWGGATFPGGKFQRPIGIGVAPGGDVYVSDARKRIVHLNASGQFLGQWGSEGNGPGQFSNPIALAIAPDGSVFVCDYDLDRVQKFTAEGRFILEFGRSGSAPGSFDAPAGLAVDASGFVYVADFYNHRVEKFSADGSFEKVIGRPGRIGDGALHYPTGVDLTPEGNLLVADAYNYQLQWFDARGRSLRRTGYHFFWMWPRPVSSKSGFQVPSDAAAASDGRIHVADSGNHRMIMLSKRGEFLTDWTIPDANPKIYSPEHTAVSPDGLTVYATDLQANRVLILKVIQTGK
ncbi:MAG: NHL repeat-containing protein [Acidobacteriota bacterium]